MGKPFMVRRHCYDVICRSEMLALTAQMTMTLDTRTPSFHV